MQIKYKNNAKNLQINLNYFNNSIYVLFLFDKSRKWVINYLKIRNLWLNINLLPKINKQI